MYVVPDMTSKMSYFDHAPVALTWEENRGLLSIKVESTLSIHTAAGLEFRGTPRLDVISTALSRSDLMFAVLRHNSFARRVD